MHRNTPPLRKERASLKGMLELFFWKKGLRLYQKSEKRQSEQIFHLFSSEADVIAMAPQYMVIAAVWVLSICTMTAPYSVVDGVGNAMLGLVISVLDGVVARIGLCIILGNTMGLSGFWLGNALAGFVTTIMAGVYYYSGAWKKRQLLLKRDEAPQ